jgi:hypothetical protein
MNEIIDKKENKIFAWKFVPNNNAKQYLQILNYICIDIHFH